MQAQNYVVSNWLSQNLGHFKMLEDKLQELETRGDALPKDFKPRVFLQFIRGSVNEIKRLTAENLAFRNALKLQNEEDAPIVEKE